MSDTNNNKPFWESARHKKLIAESEWDARMYAESQSLKKLRPFGEFFHRHWWWMALLHWGCFSLIAETGADSLEPGALGYFYAPLIAFGALYELSYNHPGGPVTYWMRKHINVLFWLNCAFSVFFLNWLLWPHFKTFDVHLAHPLREWLGRILGLGGQRGLLILIFSLIFLGCIYAECMVPRKKSSDS